MIKTLISKSFSLFQSFWYFLKGVGTKRKWVAVVIATVIVVGLGYIVFGPKDSTDDQNIDLNQRTVTLIPVSDFSLGDSSALTTAGSETVVRAETAGKIVQVVPVGTRVTNGATIALFENAGQQATLLQAEGALEVAQASFQKTEGGPRSERIATLESALESAKNSTVATLLSSYAAIDSAIKSSADQTFSNANSSAPRINFSTSNAQRVTNLENARVLMGDILKRQSAVASSLSTNSDLANELNTTENELREVRNFIDMLLAALNEAIPTGDITSTNIATYKTAVTNARTSLNTSLSSIASIRGSLETAENNLEEGVTGAEDTDLAAAAASVKQAQGAYDAALATYRKTIVAASTSGTIVSCSAGVGDVISVGSDICRIKTISGSTSSTFTLPLSSVKYTPLGAFVFVVNQNGQLESVPLETGLVTATGITVTGLFGDEFIVSDVRGLRAGEIVNVQ